MKKWKQVLAVCLMAIYVCSLSACGAANDNNPNDMAGTPASKPPVTTTPGSGNGSNTVNDAINDAGNAAGDAIDDAGNAAGDVIEDVGEGIKDVTDDLTGTTPSTR